MISRVLRRTQETQVLQALIAVHLDPYDFDWELVDSLELSESRVPRLSHSSRRYSFLFDVRDPDGYFLVCRPGEGGGRRRASKAVSVNERFLER